MRPLPPIVNEEGDEEEQPAPEMPAPETFVLPILKFLQSFVLKLIQWNSYHRSMHIVGRATRHWNC